MNFPRISSQNLRTLLAAAGIAMAVHLTQSQDSLRDLTRPILIGALHLLGIGAVDQGEMIAVGKLEVPWTRDCAGMNLLIILLALAVWVNRHEKAGLRFWLRVGFMIPAALLANVARVLTLISYRAVFYPAVESPQTHYFMGLIWLVPFVTLITPKGSRPKAHAWIETLHAAATVALLAPMSGTPNGTLVTVAAVLALSQCGMRLDHPRLRMPLTGAWMAAGAAIALSNMESFWLPWLLTCPLLVPAEWARSIGGLMVIACTNSVLAMQSWGPAFGAVALGLAALPWLKKSLPSRSDVVTPEAAPSLWQRALRYATLFCFALPFTASTVLSLGSVTWTPPARMESHSLGNDGYEIRLPRQSPHIALVCYAASGRDRHHTVKVCLKFRGTEITEAGEGSPVFTDGRHWLREFFYQDGRLLPDYAAYLRSTFKPWSSPGVHLMFLAPQEKFSPAEFDAQCVRLAAEFQALCQPAAKPATIAISQP